MNSSERQSEFSLWLKETGQSCYDEATTLASQTTDSESEPYKSKYAARKIIKKLINHLEDVTAADRMDMDSNEVNYLLVSMAVLFYDLAVNEIETEEVASGEDNLNKTLELLKRVDSPILADSLKVAVNHQFGLVWSGRSEHIKAVEHFTHASDAYKQHQQQCNSPPLDLSEVFTARLSLNNEIDRTAKFEKLHTLSLYYLAQAHANAGNPDLSATYCQETLERQLATEQYDPVDWSLNCATLSQFYLTKSKCHLARHCLASASKIIAGARQNHQLLLDDENVESDKKESESEKLLKAEADVARCWVKYCIDLLTSSHERRLRDEENPVSEQSQNSPDKEQCDGAIFDDLDVSFYEQKVTDSHLGSFDDAKQLFLFAQGHITAAKTFYVLDGYVTDYVEIQQDFSQLYKFLTYFEDNFERRCKMHKRRIDLLNPILLELNPQHFLQVSRQLMFEIAEVYTSMADLKRAITEESPAKRTTQAILKINFLILQSLKYYKNFRDSYMHKGSLPETFEEDATRGVLLTFFYSARLYSKYLTVDQATKLQYLQKEHESYEFIVRYCENHPSICGHFKEELKMSKEMMDLFKVKQAQAMGSLP